DGDVSRLTRRRSRRQRIPQFRPWMERLEDRTLLTAVNWTGLAGDSNWNTAANWSTNAVPGSADDVTINLAGANVIHSAAVIDSIHSLSLSNPLTITAGTIQISTTVSGSGLLTVGNGTLANATIMPGTTVKTTGTT